MTTATCTYVINRQTVIGGHKQVYVTFTFSTYATNGKAFAPSLFGINEYYGCAANFAPGKGWYTYDGTTLKVYSAYGTEFSDAGDAGSCQLIIYGK
jgi:hypothetical protein